MKLRVFIFIFAIAKMLYGGPFSEEPLINKVIRIHSVKEGKLMLVTVSNNIRLAEREFYLGAVYHQMALVSLVPFASNAVVHLKQAVTNHTNAIHLAWLGSALGLEGAVFYHNGEDRLSALRVEESGILLDRAVRILPNEQQIRFLRLESGLFTGKFSIYKRYRIIENDVVFLLWKKDRMNAEEQSRLYELAGELAFALGRPRRKGVDYLERAIDVSPESVFAARAMRYLEKINGNK